MVKPFGRQILAGIPFSFFSESANLKKLESYQKAGKNIEENFIFGQCNIVEIACLKVTQKHKYAHRMIHEILFINIH